MSNQLFPAVIDIAKQETIGGIIILGTGCSLPLARPILEGLIIRAFGRCFSCFIYPLLRERPQRGPMGRKINDDCPQGDIFDVAERKIRAKDGPECRCFVQEVQRMDQSKMQRGNSNRYLLRSMKKLPHTCLPGKCYAPRYVNKKPIDNRLQQRQSDVFFIGVQDLSILERASACSREIKRHEETQGDAGKPEGDGYKTHANGVSTYGESHDSHLARQGPAENGEDIFPLIGKYSQRGEVHA